MSTALFIGKVWPEPQSSAAGSRMMQLISAFLGLSYKITFASPASHSPFQEHLSALGINEVQVSINDPSFDEFLLQLSPDLVLFDRFTTEEQFGWRVAQHCPGAIRILDTEDLHFLRQARQVALQKKVEVDLSLLHNDLCKREIASIYRCDLNLIISQFELKLLLEEFSVPGDLLFYMPYLLDNITNDHQSKWISFENRSGYIFVGNFLHQPNADAVLFLKKEVWPLIRQRDPLAQLNIYGAYPSQEIENSEDPKNGFHVLGRTENIKEPMSESRVNLAPLRFGAGLKGKVVEGIRCGTPCVGTLVAAEGMMDPERKWCGPIADDPLGFAESAVQLYHDKELWQNYQQQGLELHNLLFNRKEHEKRFSIELAGLQMGLRRHREKNFTGSMLMHHMLQSTRYLSMYIEAKNKVRTPQTK
jgi:glycosyltransferase involved in cell wall biosynthesis